MKSLKLLLVTAGMAALAACGGDRDDMNAANGDLNAAETLPVDNMATNVDANLGTTNDVVNDTNMVDNTANNASDNTVNAY